MVAMAPTKSFAKVTAIFHIDIILLGVSSKTSFVRLLLESVIGDYNSANLKSSKSKMIAIFALRRAFCVIK